MTSTEEFARYICDLIGDAGTVRCRKIFGEYGIYCNDVYCACISDNMLFVKITGPGKELLPDVVTAFPYEGSKTKCFLITEFDDRELLTKLIRETSEHLQKSKSRN